MSTRDSGPGKRNRPTFAAQNLAPGAEGDSADSRRWWQDNPMTYDWDGDLGEPTTSPEYFRAIDAIFGEGHSLLNNPRWPGGSILENFIPYDEFAGRDVLEVGCGMGLVSSHIARAGANLTAIDLTSRAVAATTTRLEQAGLRGNIREMNAEAMDFASDGFDRVVSWGVIHHSGNMQRVLEEIYRVLRPGGRAYIMVYNRHSLRYQLYCRFWLGVVCGRFLRLSLDQIVGSITDGHIARHLTDEEFKRMAARFSVVAIRHSDEKTTILKYLFGVGTPFKYTHRFTRPLERWLARRWGWYLEATLSK